MGNTIRRQPVNFNIPKSPDYKHLNITDFKGLHITDNPFTGDPESATDLLNVYVDEQNTLTTRPRLQKQYSLIGVDEVIRVFNLSKKEIFHFVKDGVPGLKLLDKETKETTDVDLQTNNVTLTTCDVFEKDNKIYLITNDNYYVIKQDNIAYPVKNDIDTYAPIAFTGYSDGGIVTKKAKEAINVLNDKIRTEYFWDTTKDMSDAFYDEKIIDNNYFFEYDLTEAPWITNVPSFEDRYFKQLSKNKMLVYDQDTSGREYTITLTNKYTREDGTVRLGFIWSDNGDYRIGDWINGGGFVEDVYPDSKEGDLCCAANDTLANTTLNVPIKITRKRGDVKWRTYDVTDSSIKNESVLRTMGGPLPFFSMHGESGLDLSSAGNLMFVVDGLGDYNGRIYLGDSARAICAISGPTTQQILVVWKDDTKRHISLFEEDKDSFLGYKNKQDIEITRPISPAAITKSLLDDSVLIWTENNNNELFKITDWTTEQPIKKIVCDRVNLSVQPIVNDDLSQIIAYVDDIYGNRCTVNLFDDVGTIEDVFSSTIGGVGVCYTEGNNVIELGSPTDKFSMDVYHIIPKTNKRYKIGTLSPPKENMLGYNGRVTGQIFFDARLFVRGYVTPDDIYGTKFSIEGIRKSSFPEIITEKDYAQKTEPSFKKMFRYQNNFWFYNDGNKLYWSNNNNPTYVGEYNYSEAGDASDKITDALVLSYDVAAVFKKNNMYVISPVESDTTQQLYSIVNAKSTIGADVPEAATMTPLNEIPVFVNTKGVYGLQQVQNVQSSENVSVLMSENINPKWLKLDAMKGAWSYSVLYWTFIMIPRENMTQVFVLDDRNKGWFYWELPIKAVSGWVEEHKTYLADDVGKIYSLETTDIINEFNPDVTEYYDDDKKLIPWRWTSQILHLGTMNYSKKLVDTTFIVADTDLSDEYGLNYSFTAYRKMLSETEPTTIGSRLNYVTSTTKRTMIPRFSFLQLKISNVDDDYNNNKLRLIGLGLKYVLLEGLIR